MARPPRLLYKDARYHVTCRGNARQDIFLTDEDRERFLEQLRDSLHTHGVTLLAYVLMTNHYHLLVRTPRGNLSRFMQRLNTSYSLYYRYKHNKPGHVLQGRFGAIVVDGPSYLLALTRYIHLNPVKIRAAQAGSNSERKKKLAAYRWSSYPGYVQAESAREWVSYEVLQHCGRTGNEGRRLYRAYTEAMLMRSDEELGAALAANRYAIGDSEFIALTEAELSGWRKTLSRSKDMDLPRRAVRFERIDAEVTRRFKLSVSDLKRHGSRAGLGKAVAMELAARLSGQTQREIGAHYGGVSGQAIAMTRKKLRSGRGRLATMINKLEKSLCSAR